MRHKRSFLIALACAVGCASAESADTVPPGKSSSSSPSQAGSSASTGGATSSSSSAGGGTSSNTGGAAASGGAGGDATGTGGVGGSVSSSSTAAGTGGSDDTVVGCESCMSAFPFTPEGPCLPLANDCSADATCQDWFNCIAPCLTVTASFTSVCFEGCAQAYLGAAPLYQPVITCLCDACDHACGPACS